MARLSAGQKARNVACIIWLEDLEGWATYYSLLAFIDGLQVKAAVSPIHDKDTYTAEDVRKWVDRHIDPDYYDFIDSDIEKVREVAPKVGSPKKPHVHVLLRFDGPQTAQALSELMASFVRIPPSKWEKVNSVDAYLRYLAHLDSKAEGKHVYNALDVKGFGGIDLSCLIKVRQLTNMQTIFEVNKIIRDKGFTYYHQLNDWAIANGDLDLANVVVARCSYFRALFDSRFEEKQDKTASLADSDSE